MLKGTPNYQLNYQQTKQHRYAQSSLTCANGHFSQLLKVKIALWYFDILRARLFLLLIFLDIFLLFTFLSTNSFILSIKHYQSYLVVSQTGINCIGLPLPHLASRIRLFTM